MSKRGGSKARLTPAAHRPGYLGISRSRGAAAALAMAFAQVLLAGCGSTVTMPDVVGMRLDAAHRDLEKLDLTNFDDTDVVGKADEIFLDKNWVVVEQDPAPGTTNVDTGTTIKLPVGNEDDDEVLKLIPTDSDFATEEAKEKAEAKTEASEAERREREEAAAQEEEKREQRIADAAEYAEKIDGTLATSTRGVMRLYLKNTSAVREAGGGPEVAATNALAVRKFFDQVLTTLNTQDVSAPDSLDLNDVVAPMRDAAASMILACDELIKAIDSGAPSAFAREASYRRSATMSWNGVMHDVYGAADRKPVLWPERS